jgi:indole-3-glycerol phosphate synthase
VQASRAWSPPTGTLGGIVAEARQRVEVLRTRLPELQAAAATTAPGPSFAAALRRETVAVIAEIKRRSPSKGSINPTIGAADQARAYERGGAAAISVLTEPRHFGGSLEDLEDVRRAVTLPTLKKDFHIDPTQLVEARASGASAALLIVRALAPDVLNRMVEAAAELGLEIVVEVRDDEELERALAAGSRVIGVNSRNLETLAVDPASSERILRQIPADRIAIAESGISSPDDVERAMRSGADAVLVGSMISAAVDPAAAVRSLTGVARVPRDR